LAQNKKNFSLSITHELKTPITTTKLLVETLQNHDLPSEKKEELYVKINQEQTRLHELIDKVLLSERLGSDNFKLSQKKVNLSSFLQDEISRLPFSQFVSEEIEEGIFVMLDEFYFRSVIANLLENAHKYSESETNIIVQLKREGDNCLLTIIDEGVGIPDEEKSKVFDVYYRLENEEIRNTAGTGLGLFLVKKIITLHKGTIRIKDRIDRKGSCVEVSLQLLK
jgi:K+-sensing histidine kinase KdpD